MPAKLHRSKIARSITTCSWAKINRYSHLHVHWSPSFRGTERHGWRQRMS
jgi:hypothetical protein